jgi:hypothetical protein
MKTMDENKTITLRVEKHVGYSGRRSGNSYIARITGTDTEYIYDRSFLTAVAEDKTAMFRARQRGRGTWTECVEVGTGLYEVQAAGERQYIIVWWSGKTGTLKQGAISEDRAMAIALLLDTGQDFERARLATRPAKKAAAPEQPNEQSGGGCSTIQDTPPA